MKPMGKMKQAIKSLITFDRNDVVATVAGVFFVVIVVVGRDDGRTVFLRRIRRGRLLGPARLASGGLALFFLVVGRRPVVVVSELNARTWYPQRDPFAQSFFSTTAIKSVSV